MDIHSDESYMRIAINQAKIARDNEEIPVGAVIVHNKIVIAKTYNMTEKLKDFTAHAEMLAFTSASEYFGNKYLQECTLYVTLEPCIMCAGAAYWTKIGKIVYGASDLKKGYKTNKIELSSKTIVVKDILKEECEALIADFFINKRQKKN